MQRALNIITRLISLLTNYGVKIPEGLNNDIKELIKEFKNDITTQYNAVVTQNRSLQSELILYKKIVKLMLLDLKNGKILIDYHKQAINELER